MVDFGTKVACAGGAVVKEIRHAPKILESLIGEVSLTSNILQQSLRQLKSAEYQRICTVESVNLIQPPAAGCDKVFQAVDKFI